MERPEIRLAGSNDVNREAELKTPFRVACSDLFAFFIRLPSGLNTG